MTVTGRLESVGSNTLLNGRCRLANYADQVKGSQHFIDNLLLDGIQCESNVPCEFLRYMQRLHGEKLVEVQPFNVVCALYLTIIRLELELEMDHIREFSGQTAENPGYMQNFPINPLT